MNEQVALSLAWPHFEGDQHWAGFLLTSEMRLLSVCDIFCFGAQFLDNIHKSKEAKGWACLIFNESADG